MIQPRIEEIEIVTRGVPFEPRFQILINPGQALKTTFVAVNVRQQYDGLQRARTWRPGVGIPVNRAVAEVRQVRTNGRAKDTAVDIDHEPRVTKEFREELVKIRALPDIPKRLGLVQWNNAVEDGGTAVSGGAIGKVGADERGDLARGIVRKRSGNYTPDDRVALVMESLTVAIANPLTDRRG